MYVLSLFFSGSAAGSTCLADANPSSPDEEHGPGVSEGQLDHFIRILFTLRLACGNHHEACVYCLVCAPYWCFVCSVALLNNPLCN